MLEEKTAQEEQAQQVGVVDVGASVCPPEFKPDEKEETKRKRSWRLLKIAVLSLLLLLLLSCCVSMCRSGRVDNDQLHFNIPTIVLSPGEDEPDLTLEPEPASPDAVESEEPESTDGPGSADGLGTGGHGDRWPNGSSQDTNPSHDNAIVPSVSPGVTPSTMPDVRPTPAPTPSVSTSPQPSIKPSPSPSPSSTPKPTPGGDDDEPGGNPPAAKYKVTFYLNYEDKTEAYSTVEVSDGGRPSVPATPTRPDWQFSGWNTMRDGTGNWLDVDTRIYADTAFYAQWRKGSFIYAGGENGDDPWTVTDVNGEQVAGAKPAQLDIFREGGQAYNGVIMDGGQSGIIAPGSKGAYEFQVANIDGVACTYSLNLQEAESEANAIMKFRLVKGGELQRNVDAYGNESYSVIGGDYVGGSDIGWVSAEELAWSSELSAATASSPTCHYFILLWRWETGTDVEDTRLGEMAANGTLDYELTLSVRAEQKTG